MKTRALVVATVAAGVLAGPVLACGGEPMAANLRVTPSIKAALRAAYLRALPSLIPARVGAPVPGRTYYGYHGSMRYALATLESGSAPAQPTVFRSVAGGRWRVVRQTHGGICTDVVPLELIRLWWLEHWGGRCFVLPRR